jgi:uncharacterized membrane protein
VWWVTAVIAVVAVAAGVGMAVLWPTGRGPDLGTRPRRYVDATVTAVRRSECRSVEVVGALAGCRRVAVRLSSGARAGAHATVIVADTDFEVPRLERGDGIVVLDSPSSPANYRYTFTDFQRGTPMVLLAALFAVVVVAFGRRRGLRALVGLAASGAVLVVFIVPALLRGSPALAVALVGTVVVAYLALYLAHGLNPATTVALAGTLVSLVLIALLSVAVASAAHLFGLQDEAAQTIRVTAAGIDLRGLLVAGFIVGALGVLDDVTVTQVSAVGALLRTNPDIDRRHLYREATHIGRDHIASTVNTLVLAYAGAALPLLLFFAEGTAPAGRILTGEVVAVEIVRMLVGSIGLVLSVPVTTLLAAHVLTPTDAVAAHHHPTDDPTHTVRRRAPRRHEVPAGDRPPSWDDFAPDDIAPD